MCTHNVSQRSGFTLVEVSIVVVIIGLIIGGIMLGSSLKQGAAMQSIIADMDKYRKAALAYRDKYGELPGDHSTATSITSADAGCSTPTAAMTMYTATCNGNGDTFIGDAAGTACSAISAARYHENLWAWQHMTNAGVLNGSYNGRRASATASVSIVPGVNAPLSAIENASFMFAHLTRDVSNCMFNNPNSGHVLFFGGYSQGSQYPFLDAVLSPADAKSIDMKIDDGYPSLGKVATQTFATLPDCVNGASVGSIYIPSTSPACSLIFFLGF